MSLTIFDESVWDSLAPFLDGVSLIHLYLAGTASVLAKLRRTANDFRFDASFPLFIPLCSISRSMSRISSSPRCLSILCNRDGAIPLESTLGEWISAMPFCANLSRLRLDFDGCFFDNQLLDMASLFPSLLYLRMPADAYRLKLTLPDSLEHLEFTACKFPLGESTDRQPQITLPFGRLPPKLRIMILPFDIWLSQRGSDPLPYDWTNIPLERLEFSILGTEPMTYDFLPPTLLHLDVTYYHTTETDSSGAKIAPIVPDWKMLFPKLISLTTTPESLLTREPGKKRASPFPNTLTSLKARNSLWADGHTFHISAGDDAFLPDLELLYAEIAKIGSNLKVVQQIFNATLAPLRIAAMCPNLTCDVPSLSMNPTPSLSILDQREAVYADNIDFRALLPLPKALKSLICSFVVESISTAAMQSAGLSPTSCNRSPRAKVNVGAHRMNTSSLNACELSKISWLTQLSALQLTVIFRPSSDQLLFELGDLPSTLESLELEFQWPKLEAKEGMAFVTGSLSNMANLTYLEMNTLDEPSLIDPIITHVSQLPSTLKTICRLSSKSIADTVFSEVQEGRRHPLENLEILYLCEPEPITRSAWWFLGGANRNDDDEPLVNLALLMNLPPKLRELELFMDDKGAHIGKDFIMALPRTLEALKIWRIPTSHWEGESASCLQYLPKTISSLALRSAPKPGARKSHRSAMCSPMPNDLLEYLPIHVLLPSVSCTSSVNRFQQKREEWTKEQQNNYRSKWSL